MGILQEIGAWISSFVWGPAMLLLLIGTGLFFTVATGFLPFRHGILVLKKTVGSALRGKDSSKGSITPFQAVSTALAGTMGTGNIAGVATAIVAGGPGAIFWMWISAALGMATKYAEVLLAVKYRTVNPRGEICGGPMYYLERGLGWKGVAAVFSLLCILASFGIGNMSQVNSMADALQGTFSTPQWVTGLGSAALVGLVIAGGMKRIAAVTAKVIPLMSLFYLAAAVWALLDNRAQIPAALSLIFTSALDFRAVTGGVMGYGVLRAIRFGMARGVFSNEAGLGSAPIAHASAQTASGVEQGFWGIFEVFVDTILCCTLTTLVILTADGGRLWSCGLNGSALTTAAFAQTLGDAAGGFVAVSMVFFALSSMLGWYFYGERCVDYLTRDGKLARRSYRTLFVVLAAVGSVASLQQVWALSDIFNGLMALPNLAGILLLSPEVIADTRHYFEVQKRRKRAPAPF